MRNTYDVTVPASAMEHGDGLIHGERVSLRPGKAGFTETELLRRFGWSKDAILQYWSGSIPTAKTFPEFRRVISERDWPRDGSRRSYAILAEHHGLVGMVSCYGIDWKNRSGELGVYIGDSRLWGQGLGTDAVRTLIDHVFDDLGLRRICLNTFASNDRALRSYHRVGFRRVSTRRRFRPVIGYYKEVRMELDRDDRKHPSERKPVLS